MVESSSSSFEDLGFEQKYNLHLAYIFQIYVTTTEDVRHSDSLVRQIIIPHFFPDLSNQFRAVTGCSSGLRKSFAETIHAAGHRIVATARNLESLSYLPNESSVLKIQLDVTSHKSIATSFARVIEKFGQINVVINNAGYARGCAHEFRRVEQETGPSTSG